MKSIIFLSMVFAFAVALPSCRKGDHGLPDRKFYYAGHEKVYLKEVDNKIILRYKAPQDETEAGSALKALSENIIITWLDHRTVEITYPSSAEKNQAAAQLSKMSEIKTIHPIYTDPGGGELGITDEIEVRFWNSTSEDRIEAINLKYGVQVAKTTDVYTLLVVPAGEDALEVANHYAESGLVEFAYPNFFLTVQLF
jgi:hypothetical protein